MPTTWTPFSLDGLLCDGTVQTVRAASNVGSPNNERIVLKRFRITHVGADGTAAATVDVWKGPTGTRGDAQREARTMTLQPGQVKEYDPTFMVLEPGESIFIQATPANAVSCGGDGAYKNE